MEQKRLGEQNTHTHTETPTVQRFLELHQDEGAGEPTLIPAERHFPTASGTAARGGSIMEMRPRKQSCSVGKFCSSQSKANPRGN